MPRPSKHVSPDTLGGRIRAAREHLHLSLADVASGHYSTSLISQIERNRIEPSQESLRFLAERLQLPLKDLEHLARQYRETEVEAQDYKSFGELRTLVIQLLASKDTTRALSLLKDLHFPHIPSMQRWRLAALRGQCYFQQRRFLKAQQDFVYAVNEQSPQKSMTQDEKHDLLLLHLHLAGTYRELQQLDAALEHYRITLQLVSQATPFGYVAEAHWGMAMIAYAQANQLSNGTQCSSAFKEMHLRTALEHAENARFLYKAIGERFRAATVTCQIAQIEQTLGAIDKVRGYLEEILSSWSSVLSEPPPTDPVEKKQQQEIANIVSSAACSLAGIELEVHHYEQALFYVGQALEGGKRSYKLRRADAHIMRGRILEAMDPYNPEVEHAFCSAIEELEETHRISARVSAHVRLGRHLLKIGKVEQGEQQLEQAHRLSELASASSGTSSLTEDAQAS